MKLKKEEAKKIYEIQPDWVKQRLEEEFGKETFRKVTCTDFKTFDDLCKETKGISEEEFEKRLKDLPISDQMKRIARMEVISEGLNQEWVVDTLDTSQKKWTPIFTVSSSGLAFLFSDYDCGCTDARVGFPFVYKDEAISDYAANQFRKYWIEFLTNKPL
jgi:hypothetical protein